MRRTYLNRDRRIEAQLRSATIKSNWNGSAPNVQRIQPGAHSGMVYNYFTSTAPGITGVRSYTTGALP